MSSQTRIGALAGFAVLAGYAAFHWFALVTDSDPWRCLGCLAVAVILATALERLAAIRMRRAWVFVLAGALTVMAVAAGLVVTGVPARLVAPAGWDELGLQLDGGLAGVSQVDLPYSGPSDWTALGILIATPLTLAIAAAVAFWPARRGAAVRRGVGLALLVTLYAVSVTWESPSSELLHGIGLLACIAAYLWLGRMPASRGLSAAIAIAVCGLVAIPAAARVDSKEPLIEYGDWRIFGNERTIAFDWDHSYGPLDWPQRGTELFEVRGAERPLYWKTSVLDEFNGVTWARGDGVGGFLIDDAETVDLGGATDEMLIDHPRWGVDLDVGVLALRSSFLVTTGTTLAVDGVDFAPTAPDGTTPVPGEGLTQGSEYELAAYSPNPSADLLKRRDDGHYPRSLQRYTTLLLPQEFDQTGISPEAAPVNPLLPVTAPLRGTRAPGSTEPFAQTLQDIVRGTSYAEVAALANRLTRDAAGNYQAVAEIERYLLDNYIYDQQVAEHPDPLPAFLLEDERGYCQQFSGAMALMLRMVGIPSRVVAGFAPGLPDPDEEGTYLVRDTDAHSWVEVWFPRVGWVTVDPTPQAAPARTESFSGSGIPGSVDAFGRGRAFAIEEAAQSGRLNGVIPNSGEEEEGSPVRGIASLLVIVLGVLAILVYRRRRNRLLSPEGAGPQLRELIGALPLIGMKRSPGTTLLGIEQALAASLGPEAARYPAALRANRYGRRNPRRPGPHERRMLRRALGRGRGLGGRLRALLAIPPGGPRR